MLGPGSVGTQQQTIRRSSAGLKRASGHRSLLASSSLAEASQRTHYSGRPSSELNGQSIGAGHVLARRLSRLTIGIRSTDSAEQAPAPGNAPELVFAAITELEPRTDYQVDDGL